MGLGGSYRGHNIHIYIYIYYPLVDASDPSKLMNFIFNDLRILQNSHFAIVRILWTLCIIGITGMSNNGIEGGERGGGSVE